MNKCEHGLKTDECYVCMSPKYPAPSSKREWIKLTDEEIALVCAECAASAHNWNDISFARAIEAKLKEKNT
jgi:Zn-finger protein